MSEDAVSSEIGDAVDTVAAGKDIRQRSVRNSHNINVKLSEARDSLYHLENDILELTMDIKILKGMAEDKRVQIVALQSWVVMIGIATFLQSVTLILMFLLLWRR